MEMQSIRMLAAVLAQCAVDGHGMFTASGLRSAMPHLKDGAWKTLLSRAEAGGLLTRVCRGIYLYKEATYPADLVLCHAAALLRAGAFNYLSLESVLSTAGLISQVPINLLTLMSSGCSNRIDCGRWGAIEFVHTNKTPDSLRGQLSWDAQSRLWTASVSQALADLKSTRRNLDLVDWNAVPLTDTMESVVPDVSRTKRGRT